MGVYVDNARIRYGRMIMCHMVADTLDELHDMARRVGVSRRWFQDLSKASFPHYDVCLERRALAVSYGAEEVTRRELVAVMRRFRACNGLQPKGG